MCLWWSGGVKRCWQFAVQFAFSGTCCSCFPSVKCVLRLVQWTGLVLESKVFLSQVGVYIFVSVPLPMLFVILGRPRWQLSQSLLGQLWGLVICGTWGGCTVHCAFVFNSEGCSLFKVLALWQNVFKANKECTYLQHYCFHLQGFCSILSYNMHTLQFVLFCFPFSVKEKQ